MNRAASYDHDPSEGPELRERGDKGHRLSGLRFALGRHEERHPCLRQVVPAAHRWTSETHRRRGVELVDIPGKKQWRPPPEDQPALVCHHYVLALRREIERHDE